MTAALLIAVISVAGLAVLWRLEVSHANRLSSQLNATRQALTATKQSLAQTQSSLDAARSLSEKRRSVLVRTRAVLAGVDPILSSVDELQRDTASIQSERDTFTADTDTLMTNLVILANYAIQTDPAYMDQAYLNQLINTGNSDLSTVRADAASLGNYDAAYSGASRRFSNRADAFTNAVRRLQKQLQQVAAKSP